MLTELITFIIVIVLFCVIGYGLYWAVTRFNMPEPVRWLVGLILVVILLYALIVLVSKLGGDGVPKLLSAGIMGG